MGWPEAAVDDPSGMDRTEDLGHGQADPDGWPPRHPLHPCDSDAFGVFRHQGCQPVAERVMTDQAGHTGGIVQLTQDGGLVFGLGARPEPHQPQGTDGGIVRPEDAVRHPLPIDQPRQRRHRRQLRSCHTRSSLQPEPQG
jgi:hypothetical protein